MAPLSADCVATLKATAPVVDANGDKISLRFYELLVSRYPQVQNFFNMSHHVPMAEGQPGAQPRSLAKAVVAYAKNCDELGNLDAAVQRIVAKHIGFNILPEHYPWVGECLLAAIGDVLGGAVATAAVIEAWKAGYFYLADVLMELEETERSANEKNGGWRGWKMLRVAKKEKESDQITSFYFEQLDGSPLPDAFKAGQFLTFKIPKASIEGAAFDLCRNYSLSCAPGGGAFRISIKRMDDSSPKGAVSTYFHDGVNVGSTMEVSMPSGSFFLAPKCTKPVMLLAAGVGLTPMISMLDAMMDAKSACDKKIVYVQVARSKSAHAMAKHVDQLAGGGDKLEAHAFYTREDGCNSDLKKTKMHTGRPTAADLTGMTGGAEKAADFEYYFCGPPPFLDAVNGMLKEMGVPPAQAHFEYFGPHL